MLSVKKDYETDRNRAYTVVNSDTGRKHSVIYKIDKNEWSCDCTWNSLKETFCSHINAVVKKVNEEKAKVLVKRLGL